jgi:hypothetical protein
MHPDFPRAVIFLGSVLALQGRHVEARDVLEPLIARVGRAPVYVWTLGIAHALAGRMVEAHELLDPINRSSFPSIYRAMAHNALGERDAVFPALEQGLRERSDWMYSLGTQPLLRDLHDDPRFRAVLDKLGVPAAGAPRA